jgi:hypothetical protein
MLQDLCCLPAEGAPIELLVRMQKVGDRACLVASVLQDALQLGIVRIAKGIFAFGHDRHQAAAKASIPIDQRFQQYLRMAEALEGAGDEFSYSRADLLTDALHLGKISWDKSRICGIREFILPSPSESSGG